MNQDNELTVEVLLEEYCDGVVQFSSSHATWIAYDRASALIGASMLMGKGYKSFHFKFKNAWYVQAIF